MTQLSIRSSSLALVAFLVGGLACATAPPTDEFAEIPEADVLYEEGNAILDNPSRLLGLDMTDYQEAIDSFQEIVDNYPYSDYAVLAELRIADAYYEMERWDEALSYYRDFSELHPDNPRVPYSLFRTALSYYAQVGADNRDQTPTRQALSALDDVITKYPYSPEAGEAEVLWKELRTKLGAHVLHIGDFYLDRLEYQAAANRFRSVLNEFPGLGLDAEALYKLGVCYQNMERGEEAQQIFEVILENYDGTEIAEAAQDLIPAAN